jgi:hypothetical protein
LVLKNIAGLAINLQIANVSYLITPPRVSGAASRAGVPALLSALCSAMQFTVTLPTTFAIAGLHQPLVYCLIVNGACC